MTVLFFYADQKPRKRGRAFAHEIFNNGKILKGELNIMERNEVIELAKKIRESDTWNNEQLLQLCEAAGMKEEWELADSESFESIAYKAAEALNVKII